MKIFDTDRTSYLWNKIKNKLISKTDFVNLVYPIGSIYININNISPNTIIGGTWERFAIGRAIVGVDENNNKFSSSNLHGGEKQHTLITEEMPAHTHGTVSLTGYVKDICRQASSTGPSCSGIFSVHTTGSEVVRWGKEHSSSYDGFNCDASHEHEYVGEGKPHNNLQPYITCYIWRRIG